LSAFFSFKERGAESKLKAYNNLNGSAWITALQAVIDEERGESKDSAGASPDNWVFF